MTELDYMDWLENKIDIAPQTGIDIESFNYHPSNKEHQNAIVKRALRDGKMLIAAAFGLGKTQIQLEIARAIQERTEQKILIVVQLGVRHQFINRDGPRLGMVLQYCASDTEVNEAETPYIVTNYERLLNGNIDPRQHNFACVLFDEGNIMRSMGSKTYDVFMDVFEDVPFQYISTATPAPNEYREIIYYANFLGIADNGIQLTKWFGRNPDKAGDLQLLPQYEAEFWLWVSTWAIFLNKPSDLGFDDDGYITPGIEIVWHRLPIDYSKAWDSPDNRGQARLFQDASSSAIDMHRNKRVSVAARLAKAKEIIENTDDNVLLWHLYEYERDMIEKEIPNATTVYGSQSPEEKEKRIMAFEDGNVKILATKASIAGSGCNFQAHCHTNIFMSLDFSFNDLIQAIKRTDRFQQKHKVQVHFIYTEDEDSIVDAINRKWKQYEHVTQTMSNIIRKYGLNHSEISSALKRVKGVERIEVKSKLYTAIRNDCVLEMYNIPDNSIDYMMTSIPFGNHYEYTIQVEDFGHNPTDREFWTQMGYLIPQLLRTLKPGRKIDVHVKDRVLYNYQTWHGFTEISNFLGETRFEFRKHGFIDMGFRTIVTDVVRENNSTYRLGWSECCKDATKIGSGLPEYVCTFRKPPSDTMQQYGDTRVCHNKPGQRQVCHCEHCGWWGNNYDALENKVELVIESYINEERIAGKKCPVCAGLVNLLTDNEYSKARWQIDASSFWRSNGNSLIPQELYDYFQHVTIAEEDDEKGLLPSTFAKYPAESHSSFVWTDTNFMQGLNSAQVGRRVRKHICPLPFDIVQRCIMLNSNPRDLVFDPFAGLFTVPYLAVKMGRRGYGIEINMDSFTDGVKYLEDIERKVTAPTLFDL